MGEKDKNTRAGAARPSEQNPFTSVAMKKMLPSLHGEQMLVQSCAKGCNKPQWTKNCDVKKITKEMIYICKLHIEPSPLGLHDESLPCRWSSAAQWLTLWS